MRPKQLFPLFFLLLALFAHSGQSTLSQDALIQVTLGQTIKPSASDSMPPEIISEGSRHERLLRRLYPSLYSRPKDWLQAIPLKYKAALLTGLGIAALLTVSGILYYNMSEHSENDSEEAYQTSEVEAY